MKDKQNLKSKEKSVPDRSEMKKPELRNLEKNELIRLIALPNHLRDTMVAVISLGEVTATDVSKRTGKARSSESDYLNQLRRMGYLKRRHARRKVYFSQLDYREKDR